MKVPLVTIALVAAISQAQDSAAPPLSPPPALSARTEEAVTALEEDLPGVARLKLERLLTEDGALEGDERDQGLALLARALIESGDQNAVLELGEREDFSEENFWMGRALLSLGRPEEAEAAFAELWEADRMNGPELASRHASALALLGRGEKAEEILGGYAEGLDPWSQQARLQLVQLLLKRGAAQEALDWLETAPPEALGISLPYSGLRGQALIALDRHEEAAAILRSEAARQGGQDEASQMGVLLRLALSDALAGSGQLAESRELLVRLVDTTESIDLLEPVFARLDAQGFFETEDGRYAKLWTSDTTRPRAALAHYCLALSRKRAGAPGEAIEHLRSFLSSPSESTWKTRAELELAGLMLDAGEVDEALLALRDPASAALPPGDQARVTLLQAEALHLLGNHPEAEAAFQRASSQAILGDLKIEQLAASFNAAISRIEQDPLWEAEEAMATLANGAAHDLHLERGLSAAGRRLPEAQAILTAFVENNPGHPRRSEAELALAELDLVRLRRPKAAMFRLSALRAQKLSPATAEAVDYTLVWAKEMSGEEAGMLEEAEAYLERWPDSPRHADIRMKTAEIHFRLQDYANARVHFEKLAQEHPDSPLAGPALLFAGRSASKLLDPTGWDAAIEIWGRLAESNSELAPLARFNQAVAKLSLGNTDLALLVLDDLLAEQNPEISIDLRREVLAQKVEILLAESEAQEQPDLSAAETCLVDLASGIETASPWDYRLRLLRMKIRLREGRVEEAKEICHDALDLPVKVGPESIGDGARLEGYYQLGFSLLAILREEEQWEAAVKVCDRLARTPGQRAAEAAEIGETLRTEHFIWEERGSLAPGTLRRP